MINAPQIVVDKLKSGNVSYANLVTVNLGDAYETGNDVVLHLTDHAHAISFNGYTYTPDNNLTEIAGISRKASTGSDSVDIVFSVTDANLINVIRSERYINKPTSIDRVLIEDGNVIGDFSIPIRTAWGISHSISGDVEDRVITLTIDSVLGDLDGDNGWYAVNASHEQRYAGDKIMKHGQTVMTEEQQKKYTTDFTGVINQQIKPPALAKIYGYRNVELVPICMLKHRKTHTSYRHYFTTLIYAINIGDCDFVDINNLKKDGDDFDYKVVSDNSRDVGGWSVRVRTPANAAAGDLLSYENSSDLSFWFEGMDSGEKARMTGMYGKGLTLLFVKNRNRDNWLGSPPKLTLPVRGARVYDPRNGQTVFSRNPALQYADFLRSTEYGAGKRGIPVTDANISALADHFDQIPDSIGNDGINSILIDVQLDTGEALVDNMNIWMEGVRLYTSDYYGTFNVRVETKTAVSWVINEDDLEDFPEYESGEFTDRINQLTYTIKQLVPDTSPDAEIGDLVEVDVEATFPPDGDAIHTAWLAEDGGIQNFDSEQLSYVTELEQAYYWAMVDARISRKPATLNLPVGILGWLSEVGDVIQFSSPVMSSENELWRIDEVTEDDESVELKCVPYDDNFYTPDPNAIPTPVAPVQPPTGVTLSAVSGVSIIEKHGFQYLTWTPLSSANVSWYAVEIYQDETLVYEEQRVTQPPLLLDVLTVGEYEVQITTIGVNDEGGVAKLFFSVDLPETPTVTTSVGNFSVEVYPRVLNAYLGSTFELRINTTDDFENSEYKGKAGAFTISNLLPATGYHIWVRTVNVVGESDWVKVTVVTTQDDTALVSVLNNLGTSNFNEEVTDLLTQVQDVTVDFDLPTIIDTIQFDILGLENVEAKLSNDYRTVALDAINQTQQSALRDLGLVEYRNEIESWKLTIDEDLQQLVLQTGNVTASEWTSYKLKVDGNTGTLSSLSTKQIEQEGVLTTHTSEINQAADRITFLEESTSFGDVTAQFNSVQFQLDGHTNSINQQSMSLMTNDIESLNKILEGAITDSNISELNVNLSIAKNNISSLTTDTQALAQSNELLISSFDNTVSEISKINSTLSRTNEVQVEDKLFLIGKIEDENSTRTADIAQINQLIIDNESAQATQINQINTRIDDNASSITTISNSLANETETRAQQISTLTTNFNTNSTTINSISTALSNEIETRAQQVDTLTTNFNTNSTTISSISTALSNETTTRAQQVDTLTTAVGENTGSITQLNLIDAASTSTLVQNFLNLKTTVGTNSGDITQLNSIDVNSTSTLVQNFLTLRAATYDVDTGTAKYVAAVDDLNQAITGEDGAIAAQAIVTEAKFYPKSETETTTEIAARVAQNNKAYIGYCDIGALGEHTDKASCELAGGNWVAATPFANSMSVAQIQDKDGNQVTAGTYFTAMENSIGELEGRVVIGTDVNGNFAGIYINNVLTGSSISFMSHEIEFVNPDNGQIDLKYDAVDNLLKLRCDLVAAGGTFTGTLNGVDGDFEGTVKVQNIIGEQASGDAKLLPVTTLNESYQTVVSFTVSASPITRVIVIPCPWFICNTQNGKTWITVDFKANGNLIYSDGLVYGAWEAGYFTASPRYYRLNANQTVTLTVSVKLNSGSDGASVFSQAYTPTVFKESNEITFN